MNTFRTIVPPLDTPVRIGYQDAVLSLGSCFAENIGRKLQDQKLPICLNPYGILYNPISLQHALHFLLQAQPLTETAIFEHQGIWNSYWHHGQFAATNADDLLSRMNAEQQRAVQFLQRTNRIILTLGTAYVWWHRAREQVVANCHKLPASAFLRKKLTPTQIVEALSQVFERLKVALPDVEIIMTVSPVRHTRDGLVNNQRSKASLLLAIEKLVENYAYVHYFPAYELMMDDLRDYRFYGADYTHPNALAIEYIWQYFTEAYFEPSTLRLMQAVEKVKKAVAHRPLRPDTAAFQEFVYKQIERITQIEAQYGLDFTEEKAQLHTRLS